MIRRCIVLFIVIIFISCGNENKTPPGILKPDKMQVVLWDVIRADAFTTAFIKKDSAKNAIEENVKLQQQVFAIHHISKDDFYKSYDYYKSNTGLMKEMVDSMISQAERAKSRPIKIVPIQAE